MDLTRALLRYAAHAPHVLLVPVPGAAGLRMEVEHAVASRRWREATGPADTDVLIVVGRPGHEMRAVIAEVWRRVPAPRLRIDLDPHARPADVSRRLDQVPDLLADPQRGHREAESAATRHEETTAAGDGNVEDGDHNARSGHSEHQAEDPGAGHTEHAGHHGHEQPHGPAEHGEHGDTGHTELAEQAGHTEHTGHDHHAHHHVAMPLPGGLAMADVAEDRDGLALDVLNLPLGPVLPDWPAGLVLDVVLQGDVISSAEARVLDAPRATREDTAGGGVVRDLDVVARVLSVAGWPGPAARARSLRERVRAGAPREEVAGELTALARRVRRSRTLRLMLVGLGRTQRTDVADLLRRHLSRIEAYAGGQPTEASDEPAGLAVRDLGSRLAGAELAAARLLVAALDPRVPDTAEAGRTEGVGR
ncbi:hypothetical protein [Streptomyces oceani]|uniref:Uncharacterized protein n=1 Tax=Streptomyces oceani TaxID=1075402 RepID=A0A1E7KJU2_9ACTN|nr:hypothetical protein [Streptomyces oceani]OEV04238.1 hypothetical protein AN216_08535 [Streptomyces oceani]